GAFYLSGSDFHDTRALVVLAGALVIVTFLYLTLATALTGRTLGMRMLSLRVIDTKTGLIPTGGQSIGRSFFYLLSLPTVVGILFALVSREGYTAHDRFTRTAVVVT
ncbi:MAG TPA: RDD family protein, partial [Pyrinomonadaceae bacterium]|nr:RDD family protein [Pyrinomonadaceae bacterium]